MKKNYQIMFFTFENYFYKNKSISNYLEDISNTLKIPGITLIKTSKDINKNKQPYFLEKADKPLEIIMNFNENDYIKFLNYLEKEPLNFFYTKTSIENDFNIIEVFILD